MFLIKFVRHNLQQRTSENISYTLSIFVTILRLATLCLLIKALSALSSSPRRSNHKEDLHPDYGDHDSNFLSPCWSWFTGWKFEGRQNR